MISQIPVTSARNLREAYDVLAQQPNQLRILAGGTDLMVQVNARVGVDRIGHVLDIWKVPELRGIHREGDRLRIGALVTYSELIASSEVRAACPALSEVSKEVGAWAIQNRGTVGGNLCNASPAGDTLPVLIAADAQVRVGGPRGERVISIDDFFVSYRKTALAPDELLLDVTLPALNAGRGERIGYRKVGTRKAQSISKVLLAVKGRVSGEALSDVRIGVGCVAAVPLRCRTAEAAVQKSPRDASALRSALDADIRPIDDVRSTADYRRQVAGNVLFRLVEQLLSSSR